MKISSLTKITILTGLTFAFLGSFAGEASGQTHRQTERERQRHSRQEQRNRERYEQQRNRTGRYENDLHDSRSAGLNNAVRMGYQQGSIAGEWDRRKKKYNQSNVYRNTDSSPYSGDPTAYDYLYRQGYLDGYNDGYYGRRRF